MFQASRNSFTSFQAVLNKIRLLILSIITVLFELEVIAFYLMILDDFI